MPWAALADDFHSHPKIIAAGLAATGLYARSLSYCACYLTDGHIPKTWAHAGQSGPKIARRLVQFGLWVETDEGYMIPDYTQFNPTREYVKQQRSDLQEKRAAAGRRGALKRWQYKDNTDSNDDGKPIANAMANGMASVMTNGWPPTPTPVLSQSSSAVKGAARAETGRPAAAAETLLEELSATVRWDPPKVAAARSGDEERAVAWLQASLSRDDVRNPGGWAWHGYQTGDWPSERKEGDGDMKGQNLAGSEINHADVLDYCAGCGGEHRMSVLDSGNGFCPACVAKASEKKASEGAE